MASWSKFGHSIQDQGDCHEVAPSCLLVALGCVLRAHHSGCLKAWAGDPMGSEKFSGTLLLRAIYYTL